MEFDEIALRPCTLKDCAALSLVGAATFLEAFAGILDGIRSKPMRNILANRIAVRG